MASPESIHQLLRVASRLLDQAASEIRDAQLEPVRGNIRRIGQALSEIIDIEQQIFAIRPELRPAYLNEPSPHPEANKRLTRFMSEALELEDAARFDDAIAKYKEYLAIEDSPDHRAIAEREIERLSTDKGGAAEVSE